MKSLSLLALTTLLACSMLFVVCKSESHLDNPYQGKTEKELEILSDEKYHQIVSFASPVTCTNADDWKLMEIQSMCGASHLAYHRSVDKTTLRNKINDYNRLMEVYRPLIAPRINCAAYQKPLGVRCNNGKGIVGYEQTSPGY